MESLKCSICGQPAAAHIERIVQTIKQSINSCETCARSYGVLTNNMMPFSVAKNIGAALFGDISSSISSHDYCNNCGHTVDLFKKTGNLGCPQCYDYLEEKLLPLIENMQKSLVHIGKQPKGVVIDTQKVLTKELLEEKLQQAIEREHFEEAAQIRDKLRSLQNGND
ncbi:MAG: UvrB/UvrC motif-containing protein [Puniceicoccales bacterium]|jgi:protein arginine kinase activator|nr:UvrB/UvrC motif-containing protein [Puniceicoccales bacterium]